MEQFPYMDSNRMKYIETIDDIDKVDLSFLKEKVEKKVQYDGQFSPIKLFEEIESITNLDTIL